MQVMTFRLEGVAELTTGKAQQRHCWVLNCRTTRLASWRNSDTTCHCPIYNRTYALACKLVRIRTSPIPMQNERTPLRITRLHVRACRVSTRVARKCFSAIKSRHIRVIQGVFRQNLPLACLWLHFRRTIHRIRRQRHLTHLGVIFWLQNTASTT